MRADGRRPDELRPFELTTHVQRHALGSALVRAGGTRVLCAVSASRLPPFVQAGGWLTAEYAMLPGSTAPRASRDPGGRGKEIQRLIGRALRGAIELGALVDPDGLGLGLTVDCDVLDADGGTRTAAITGGWVALGVALDRLAREGRLARPVRLAPLAAVSVGIVELDGRPTPVLDLPYEEDSRARVDANVVGGLSERGVEFIEVQSTGEAGRFSRSELGQLLDLAEAGLRELSAAQARALAEASEPR